MGHTPSTAGTFRKKFRKNSGKTPETLSERFLEFPSRARLGSPKPYNSRHLRLPEHFQNSLPPSTAGSASFSRSVFGEGLSELVMEGIPSNTEGISELETLLKQGRKATAPFPFLKTSRANGFSPEKLQWRIVSIPDTFQG